MDKINFEDLPSTNTPIDATNLNKLQTNVEKAFIKSSLNVAIKQAVTITQQNTETLVPMTIIQSQTGDGFQVLTDGTIKALKDMTVFISTQVIVPDVANNNIRLSILKNDKVLSSDQHTTMVQFSTTIATTVKQNDIIKVGILNYSASSGTTGSAYNTNNLNIIEI